MVLRFIGDAALAIFPVDGHPAGACESALACAHEAISRMEKLNKKRDYPLAFGIGLHIGEVTYGNVGTPTRLEFTVVGAAASEAARICRAHGSRLAARVARRRNRDRSVYGMRRLPDKILPL